jgi:hypothetical protein
MINVFFESARHAEKVATFEEEQIYIDCLPVLQAIARQRGMTVTEFQTDEKENK